MSVGSQVRDTHIHNQDPKRCKPGSANDAASASPIADVISSSVASVVFFIVCGSAACIINIHFAFCKTWYSDVCVRMCISHGMSQLARVCDIKKKSKLGTCQRLTRQNMAESTFNRISHAKTARWTGRSRISTYWHWWP